MRDEDKVQEMANKAAAEIAEINEGLLTAAHKVRREYLRGVSAALDWALEDLEDDPVRKSLAEGK